MKEEVIVGAVVEIVYQNGETGFTICEVDSAEEGLFTAKGYMPYVSAGENLSLTGRWGTHPEYGEQFNVESYRNILPDDEKAILMYLSSGIVPGVRRATAKKLVDRFGKNVFDIMRSEPLRMSEISGISEKKALKIGEEFMKQQSVQSIVMFLQQFSVPARAALKIHRMLGDSAVEQIKQNPYVLSERVDGVSFKTADNIADTLNIPKNSPERIRAFIKYTLINAAYSSGHTYLPRELLSEHIVYNLQIEAEEAESAVSSLLFDKDVYVEEIGGREVCYSAGLMSAEVYVAGRLAAMASESESDLFAEAEIDGIVDRIAGEENIALAEEQHTAVAAALRSHCTVITGGPGTGKTTAIKLIIRAAQQKGLEIALAAPTGRAAKRMTEVTGLEAKTIHRLLGACMSEEDSEYAEGRFEYDEENPLKADLIILDETSMLDINLMNSFLRAVKRGGRIVLVGDADQLPSVGPGRVLKDIISSGILPVTNLSYIFRQARESLIVINAHNINHGKGLILQNKNTDFYFMKRSTVTETVETIADLYQNRLPYRYDIDPLSEIQILSPARKGLAGVNNINRVIQERINPPDSCKAETTYGKTVFRVGDKVMQTRNNYDLCWTRDDGEEGMGIYNGDMGIITQISNIDKIMTIVFDEDKTVEYAFSYLDELEQAYAITVHKSQGNEFPIVIIPMCNFPEMLMLRNLLYTAITRARKMVILVGSEACTVRMIANNSEKERYTGLAERLRQTREIMEENAEMLGK